MQWRYNVWLNMKEVIGCTKNRTYKSAMQGTMPKGLLPGPYNSAYL